MLTLDSSHRGLTVDATANSFTISLTAAATLGSGWHVTIFNSGSGTVVIDPNGSETILTTGGAVTTVSLTQGTGYTLECDGVGFGAIAGTTTSGSGSPTGAAGGDLSGTYPNPTVKWASPGTIGSTSASTGKFTTIEATTTLTMDDAANVVLNTTTGTKIGTGTTQKLGFYNTTPVVQQTGNVITALSNLGLCTSGTIAAATNLTGLVPIANGGTNVGTLAASALVTANAGATAYTSSTNLTYVAPTLALTSASDSLISSTTSSTTGSSALDLFNNLGNYGNLAIYGSAVAGTFLGTGVTKAGLVLLRSNVGPLLINTGTTATIFFAYNDTVVAKFDSATTLTFTDGVNLVTGTTTGMKIGTGTTQKLAFYNSTPVVQQTGSIKTAMTTLGLMSSPTIPATDISAALLTVNAIISGPSSATAGDGGRIELRELAANGTSAVKISAPDSLAADTAYTLPSALPASSGSALVCDTSGLMSWSASSTAGFSGYIVLEEQAVSGVSGQTLVSTSWNKRNLSTTVVNSGGYMTLLSANRFTLAAGTYRLTAVAPVYKADRHRLRLFNFTDTTVIATGNSFYCETTISGGVAYMNCRFTLATAKALQIDHYANNGVVSGGGVETSDGSLEIYTHVEILRE